MRYSGFIVDISEKDGYSSLTYDKETFDRIDPIGDERRLHSNRNGYSRLRIRLLLKKLGVI